MHEHDAPRRHVAQPDESEQRCPVARVLWVRAVADCLIPILVWCANLELHVEDLDSFLLGERGEPGPVVHVVQDPCRRDNLPRGFHGAVLASCFEAGRAPIIVDILYTHYTFAMRQEGKRGEA